MPLSSSNSIKISTKEAIWTTQASIGQTPPKWVTDGLDTFEEFLDKVKDFVQKIIDILKAVEGWFGSLDDLLLSFIMGVVETIIAIFMDSLASGGSYILIHPYNSKLSVEVDLLSKNPDGSYKAIPKDIIPTPVPGAKTSALDTISDMASKAYNWGASGFPIKTLTPQQAFNDFFNSFQDVSDKNRPLWTVDDYAVGFGLVIATADISGFISLATTLQGLFSFPELDSLITGFTADVNTIRNDLSAPGKSLDAMSAVYNLNLDAFKASWGGIASTYNKITKDNPNHLEEQKKLWGAALDDQILKTRHWTTLSLNNIPILANLDTEIRKFIKTLLDLITDVDEFISAIIEAIVKKLEALLAALDSILSAIHSIVSALEYTGLYSFKVPTGLGGTQYVISAIKKSLATSPLAGGMNSSMFTLLFFAGAGAPGWETLGTWADMFGSVLGDFQSGWNAAGIDLLDSLDTSRGFSYKISPDFTKTIYRYGDVITLKVTSPDSGYYYTYTITDSDKQEVSKHTQTNILAKNVGKVNESTYTFALKAPKNSIKTPIGTKVYTLKGKIFDAFGATTATINQKIMMSDTITLAGEPLVPPTFTPASGTYKYDQMVNLSGSASGVSYFYTLDETTPNPKAYISNPKATTTKKFTAPIEAKGAGTTVTITAMAVVPTTTFKSKPVTAMYSITTGGIDPAKQTSSETANQTSYGGREVCSVLGATVNIRKGNRIIETIQIPAGTCMYVGRGLEVGEYMMEIIDKDGTILYISFSNFSGYYDYIFTSAYEIYGTPFLRVKEFPVIIYMYFEDMINWNLTGETPRKYDVPEYIKVTKAGTYQYTIYDEHGNAGDLHEIVISLYSDTVPIC